MGMGRKFSRLLARLKYQHDDEDDDAVNVKVPNVLFQRRLGTEHPS